MSAVFAETRVAYLGAPGTFSYEALHQLLPEAEAQGYESFPACFAALRTGHCGRAVLPVINSIAGEVPETAAMLAAGHIRALHSWEMPVRLHLLVLPGSDIGDITEAASHPMALKQCAIRLGELGISGVEVANTVSAARDVAAAGDGVRGAIASGTAARLFGLDIAMHDLQDADDNRTLFALVERQWAVGA